MYKRFLSAFIFFTLAFHTTYAASQTITSKRLIEDEQPKIEIVLEHQNKSYVISAHRRYIQLIDINKENPIVLQKVRIDQDHGNIQHVKPVRKTWLWIDGDQPDYLAKLSFSQRSLGIETPKEMPKLYGNRCNYLYSMMDNCLKVGWSYDENTDYFSATGYPKSILGLAPSITLKLLPSEIVGYKE